MTGHDEARVDRELARRRDEQLGIDLHDLADRINRRTADYGSATRADEEAIARLRSVGDWIIRLTTRVMP